MKRITDLLRILSGNAIRANLPRRVEYLQQKYPEIDVQDLGDMDPSHGRYLTWMVNQARRGEDRNRIVEAVRAFHKLRLQMRDAGRSIDINQYKTVDLLNEELKHHGSTRLYQDEDWTVDEIHDHRTLCEMGTENWCVARPSQPHWWDDYQRGDKDPRFFLITRHPEGDMYLAFIAGSELVELRDEEDESVDDDDVIRVLQKAVPGLKIEKLEKNMEFINLVNRFGYWATGGDPTHAAQEWVDTGMSLGSADSWLEAGVYDPSHAVYLNRAGVTPHEYEEASDLETEQADQELLLVEEVISLLRFGNSLEYNREPLVQGSPDVSLIRDRVRIGIDPVFSLSVRYRGSNPETVLMIVYEPTEAEYPEKAISRLVLEKIKAMIDRSWNSENIKWERFSEVVAVTTHNIMTVLQPMLDEMNRAKAEDMS